MTRDELLLGTAFHLSGGGQHPGEARISAWGRFATGGFDAEEDGVTLDGEVTSGLLGADARWDRVLAGVMVSQSRGTGSYRLAAELGSDEGIRRPLFHGLSLLPGLRSGVSSPN